MDPQKGAFWTASSSLSMQWNTVVILRFQAPGVIPVLLLVYLSNDTKQREKENI